MVQDTASNQPSSGDVANEDERTAYYLSSLAVEDLREYDAILLSVLILLIGLFLSIKCGKLLSRLREKHKESLAKSTSSALLDNETSARKRRKQTAGKKGRVLDSDDELDDLAAEEQAFLEQV